MDLHLNVLGYYKYKKNGTHAKQSGYLADDSVTKENEPVSCKMR